MTQPSLAIKKNGLGNRIALSKYDFSHRLPPVYLDFDLIPMKFFQRSQADPKQAQKNIESMVLGAIFTAAGAACSALAVTFAQPRQKDYYEIGNLER